MAIKITAAQRTVLACDAITGNAFAGTTTWFMNKNNVTPTVKSLIAKNYMRRSKVGIDAYKAIITDEGLAALNA